MQQKAPRDDSTPEESASSLEQLQAQVRELRAELRAREETEQRLRRQLDELADFVENAAEGLHRVGRDGTILWANRAELNLLGYEPHEYIGRNITEFHADRPVIDDILGKLTKGEVLRDQPARLVCKDGSIRDVLIHSSVRFEGERFVHTRCFTRDVTHRRQAEQALRENEKRYRALMQQSPWSVQVFAPDGRTVSVNQAWVDLWGVTFEQVADYNILQDPQLEAKGIRPCIVRAFAGETVQIPPIAYDPNATLPGRTRHAEPVRWVSATAYPVKNDAGELTEVVLIHNDITARRQAEAALRTSEVRFRLLADTIPQLAWMAEADGNITWYNRGWYEYTGTTLEQMQGWGWQSVHDPEILPEVLRKWRESIATGQPFEMVFPLRGADGRFRPFLTRVNPLRNDEGVILNWFGTNTDVSEIKAMEQALRDADRRKDEFLATLAHELRNPLAPIRTSLQILRMPRIDAAAAQQTREVIERQVNHLVRLVDDLLDVSRVMSGKITLKKETVELASVVAQAVETAQPLIEARRHRLEISLPEDALPVHGDPVRLAQVIGNVLVNAAKYTESEGHIRLSARKVGNRALLSVSDDGIGIAPDMLPHVFELFAQAEHGTKRAQGGLGIGLTLARNLAELHGGTLDARSEGLGKGSEFTLSLPLVETAAEQSSRAPSDAQTAVSAGHRLMVVDDNADAAESLAMLLRLQGHDVDVAFDGESALEIVKARQPELVFLDIGMPGLDGYEVARRIRALPEGGKTVIAALSGWGQSEDRKRSAAAGFDHHLVKPPELNQVEEIVAGLGSR